MSEAATDIVSVVDDDASLRRSVRNLLTSVGFRVQAFASAEEFLESPLITDHFLSDWLEIAPAESREEVLGYIASIIERERNNMPFGVSIKAAVITGVK